LPRSRLTLEEIAKLAGVSRSTVSRVINEDPNVSEAARSNVLKVVQEVGYQPNAAARSLASNRSNTISVVIPRPVSTVFTEPFFVSMLQSITEVCNDNGYHVILSMVDPTREQSSYYRSLSSLMLDGVILFSGFIDDPLIPQLERDDIPFVVVGRHPKLPDASFVDVDNVQSSAMATRHLLDLGRQRLATITGPMSMPVGIDRHTGFMQAAEQADMYVPDARIVEGDFGRLSGYEGMKNLLPHKPDSVVIASDLMAVGAMLAIRESGLSIPDDIAVVGFDDAPIAAYSEPPLTTIRQSFGDLGRNAASMLLKLINEEEAGPIHTIIPTELIVRASTVEA